MEDLFFYNAQGHRLAAKLYYPTQLQGEAKALPTLVLCQGLSGVKHKVLPQVAHFFAEQGYLTLAFDYRGCGESEGNPHHLLPLERVNDIQHAIARIQQHPAANPQKTYLYGLSYGAATCIAAAATANCRISAVAAVSGAADGNDFMQGLRTADEWLKFKALLHDARVERSLSGKEKMLTLHELVPLSNAFWEAYKKLDSPDASQTIPQQQHNSPPTFTATSAEAMTAFTLSTFIPQLCAPTCIIHGELDDCILLDSAIKIYHQLSVEKQIHIIPNSDHIDLDHGAGLKQQLKLALAWFKKY